MQTKKYHIKPKRDFGPGKGFFINGKYVKSGFVVTDGGIVNVMPGATWFGTIREALKGIDALILAKGNSQHFWEILRKL